MGCDESVVIGSALRYMLGRGSYGVGCVCDYIKANLARLTKSNKEVMRRDIAERIAEYPEMACRKDWEELSELLK